MEKKTVKNYQIREVGIKGYFCIDTTFITNEKLKNKLLSVPGVQNIQCCRYEIAIFPALAFDREELKKDIGRKIDEYCLNLTPSANTD